MNKTVAIDSQNKKILHYLESHKNGITSMVAFSEFGITRLSGRIYDLRQMGYPIVTTRDTKVNREGKQITFARYTL